MTRGDLQNRGDLHGGKVVDPYATVGDDVLEPQWPGGWHKSWWSMLFKFSGNTRKCH